MFLITSCEGDLLQILKIKNSMLINRSVLLKYPCLVWMLHTVMIQFSAKGPNLLKVAQRRDYLLAMGANF